MDENKEEHFVGKVAQKAIILKGDEVLIVRSAGDSHIWELPGGRLRAGEDPKSGLVRELREELGVEVVIGDAIFMEQFVSEKGKEFRLALIYKASFVNDSTALVLQSNEIEEIAWVNKSNWQEYSYFVNYERALRFYFDNYSIG